MTMNFPMILKSNEIWKFIIRFSKIRVKEERKQREELETTLKLLKKSLPTEENQCLYDKC